MLGTNWVQGKYLDSR